MWCDGKDDGKDEEIKNEKCEKDLKKRESKEKKGGVPECVSLWNFLPFL